MDERIETEETCAAPCRGRLHFAGRCGVFAVRLCGGGIVLALLLLAGLAVLLSRGPFETEAASRVAEAALAGLGGPGATARVGTAGLDWSWTRGVSVTLSDVSLERGAGLRLAVPRVVAGLRLLPLFVGSVRPRALEIADPTLTLDTAELRARPESAATPVPTDRPDGAAPGSEPAAVATVPVSTRLAEAADVAVERILLLAREQGIETIALHGGAVTVHHVGETGAARDVGFRELEVDAVVDGPGGDVDAGLSARGEVGRWTMRLTRSKRDDGGHRLTFAASDVTLPDLIGKIAPPFRFDMPFYPRLRLAFDRDGRFDGADFDLRIGAGVFRFGGMREDELLFDEVSVKAMWNPRDRVFAVERAEAALGDTHWAAHGRITPPTADTGRWAWTFDLDPGSLKPRDVPGPAVPIRSGSLTGTWDAASSFLDVALGEIRFGETAVRSAGRLDLSGADPKLTYDLQFAPLTTSEVIHGWPTWVAAEARDWFIKNVAAGRLSDLRIQLQMPRFDHPETWSGDAMRVGARFDGVRFSPLGNLPALTAAEGRISVVDRRFEVAIDKGRSATKGREPTVDGFRFAVADIFVKPARGSFRLHVAGDTGSLAEIVDAEPLASLSQSGIAATGLAGTGSVTAQIDLLFTDPIDADAIDYRIEAQLDGFSAQQPIQGRRFQDGKFKIVADRHGLDVAGRAVIDGVPADLHVYEPHGAAKGNEKRDFKMEVDDAARQRLGIDLGGVVEGAIGLAVSQPDPNQLRSRIEADLTPARLNLTPLGWSKGPGVPAKATFDLWDDDKGLHVDNVALDSEGVSLRGNIVLDRDRNLVSADFSKFALRKGEAAKVKVTRGADKALTIAFEGSTFDARGLLQYSRRPPLPAQDAAKEPDLILKLKVGRVEGFNGMILGDVTVDGRWKGGAFQNLEFRGRTGPKSPLSVAIRPEGDHRRFTVVSEDAGAILSFLDLFDRIEAGKLTLSARLGAPGTSEGELRLVAFHLLEEPKSGRGVSSEQAADGTRRIAIRRAEIDRSTDFDRAQVRFAMHDGIIDVVEGIAKGTSVGATATGQLDLTAQRLSLSGTYIPAYGLNNLAGRIPIFGAITGAGSNEGLLGVTFRVGGPVADPILQINPLSAVAPGIFRRVFEFQREDMPQSSGDPNAPTNIMPDIGPTKITP